MSNKNLSKIANEIESAIRNNGDSNNPLVREIANGIIERDAYVGPFPLKIR